MLKTVYNCATKQETQVEMTPEEVTEVEAMWAVISNIPEPTQEEKLAKLLKGYDLQIVDLKALLIG